MPGVIITLKKHRQDGKPRYRARWTTPYRDTHPTQPVYKVHSDKKWLQEWLRQMDQAARDDALNPQPPTPPRQHTVTFQQLVDTWRKTHLQNLTPRTVTRYEGLLRNYLLPAWGTHPLVTIDRETVKLYFAGLATEHTPAQVRKVQIVASSVFAEGVELGYTPFNPASRIDLPAPPDHDMLFLTARELAAVANHIDPRYKTAVYVAGYAGLRASELWALRRQDVDLQAHRLHVRKALKRSYGRDNPTNAPLFGPPKNGKPRTVTLPNFLAELLTAHLAANPQSQSPISPTPSALVFTAPEGGVVRHELFRRRFWTPAIRRAVASGALSPDKAAIRFHDLRHTAASLFIATGAYPDQVRDRLGHRDTRTTARYSHLYDGHDASNLAALDAAYDAIHRLNVVPLRPDADAA